MKRAITRPIFITFEGIEGSGKTTQFRLLVDELAKRGLPLVSVREPGGTPVGDRIRSVLLDPALSEMTSETEALLYAASRSQLVSEVIGPALSEGNVVVCDRYLDSSIAYQVFARGLSRDFIVGINERADGLRPDVTFLLDIDPAIGLARATKNGADRLERLSLEFHERVREGYLDISRSESRFCLLDGSLPPDEIHEAIVKELDRKALLV